MTDPRIERAGEQLDLFLRVVPGLIRTCARLTAEAHSKARDLGYTPEQYAAMTFDDRDKMFATWRRTFGRRKRRDPR